eukprot:11178750-Heterocapsa_arctica.AAC.1
MGIGRNQEVAKHLRQWETARGNWGQAARSIPALRTEEHMEEAGGLDPRLEPQHNGTTGIRIGEAKKPGQGRKSWSGITANITSWNTSGLSW